MLCMGKLRINMNSHMNGFVPCPDFVQYRTISPNLCSALGVKLSLARTSKQEEDIDGDYSLI